MTEESTPYVTQEQAKQLNRSLMEKLLDRAASDPAWKQQLLDDPEAALRAANFPETQQIQRMQEQAEVGGHVFSDPTSRSSLQGELCHYTWDCAYFSWFYWKW